MLRLESVVPGLASVLERMVVGVLEALSPGLRDGGWSDEGEQDREEHEAVEDAEENDWGVGRAEGACGVRINSGR